MAKIRVIDNETGRERNAEKIAAEETRRAEKIRDALFARPVEMPDEWREPDDDAPKRARQLATGGLKAELAKAAAAEAEAIANGGLFIGED